MNIAYAWALPAQEERAEQLRSFSFLSSIVAGFAIASFLQLTFNVVDGTPDANKPGTPQAWQLGFAITVGLTVRASAWSMTVTLLK